MLNIIETAGLMIGAIFVPSIIYSILIVLVLDIDDKYSIDK